jgi:ATP-binding cassette subfamily B protein
LPPSANFWFQLRQARVPQRLLALAGAHAIQYVLWILAWWVIGRNVFSGRSEGNWLLPWALLLLSLVPIRLLITWLQGRIAIAAGGKLKQRLFFGALRLEPDSIRHQGAGQLLGRVIESEAVEALALSGGFLGLVAIIELAIAAFVLAAGAGGALQAACLAGWLTTTGIVAWLYFRHSRDWTDVRLAMTHDLVESMVGHRTRLAQLSPDRWHEGEDEALERYLRASKRMDEATAALTGAVPRGWLVVGLIGLAPAFMGGTSSTAGMAVAVGGMLLAYRALKRLAAGTWQVAGAAVAWERVSVLYRSATNPELLGSASVPMITDSPAFVDARDLVYRYHERHEPVLRGCSLQIRKRDRVVLEGPSGGGKSTLVSILTGLREPNAGELRMDGSDLHTLGSERWRQRIAAAPQFHENYVLAETLAFNLLMGRRRPLGAADLNEAEAICQELGLGGLLGRMPAGIMQMVGETGWQLSHGERSRLYIARALLQDAEVVVLDESFAALDPEILQRAMQCVLKRARSLLVVAHR